MKNLHTALFVLSVALISSGAAAQQMYKWVGKDGKINYTDTPPPGSAKPVEIKTAGGGSSSSAVFANLPYEIAQVAKNNPVTLYTGTDCAPCDGGRTMLTARGIPFSEKTVKTTEDGQRLKQAGGNGTLPLLVVGRSQQIGFDAAGWGTLLSAAGYPESSRLPASYKNPAAESAAPKVVKEITTTKKNPEPAPVAAPASPSASGFRF